MRGHPGSADALTFYRRLRAAGKQPEVALVAAVRKLLSILNAMVKAQRPWQPA